jgi:hypothetical protein
MSCGIRIRQSKFYHLIISKTGFLTFVGQPIEDGLAGLPVGGHHIHPYLVADGLNGFLTDNLLQRPPSTPSFIYMLSTVPNIVGDP